MKLSFAKLALLGMLALGGAVLDGCYYHITATGTDPLPAQFYYPVGVLIDPDGRLLYVSNGNADLRYGGGTLMAIDLPRFHCAVEAFRQLTDKTVVLDPGCSIYPTASDIAVVRDDNNMPTHGCISDPTDPQIADCQEGPFILSNATVRVGNFAGTMRVQRVGGAGSTKRTLYLAVRGDPSITFANIDLSELAAKPDVNGHVEQVGFIDCFDDRSELLTRDGFELVNGVGVNTVPQRCDPSHLVQTYTCNDRFGCLKGDNEIPSEPFNMLLEQGVRTNGQPYSHLIVSHLSAGQVTLIDLLGTPYVADVSQPFFAQNTLNEGGGYGLMRVGTGDSPLYYFSSDLVPQIATFRIASTPTGEIISPDATFGFNGTFQVGSDGRMLIEDPDQQRAYFAENAPPQLAIIDTSLGYPNSHGLPANKIVNVVDICNEPSNMVLRQFPAPPGSTNPVTSRIWVSCFTANQLMLVDPDLQIVDETVLMGRGPSEMAFNYSGIETPTAQQLPTPAHFYAYVTEYGQSTVGVVDLDPGSRSENRVIARIGLPQPPPNYLTQH